ncbi:MAG: NAD(P)-dependent oxidoreductase [Acholeplasmataceae bacterium]|nr:NAD(P)-dependent oxidoreductase [Acholeplasmataceae bacterium]
MKIIILGGTGLLGSAAAKLMIENGHSVSSISLPPVPENLDIPKQMKVILNNYMTMSDKEIEKVFMGYDAFVFAAGVDERVEFEAPVYDAYVKYNIEPLSRMLKIAKKVGIRHAVILGSYFSYFAKTWTHLKLEKHHPYIRSRIEQERVALAFADEKFFVNVLELPYIFGVQNGRKPVWTIFVKQFEKPKTILFPKGGTAMVTVNQVAHAIYHSILFGDMKKCYPIGYFNMDWKQLIHRVLIAMDMPNKKVITVPKALAYIGFARLKSQYRKKGIEPGLHPTQFLKIMSRKTYIEPELSKDLQLPHDDINQAIDDSISYAYKVFKNEFNVLEMKVK